MVVHFAPAPCRHAAEAIAEKPVNSDGYIHIYLRTVSTLVHVSKRAEESW